MDDQAKFEDKLWGKPLTNRNEKRQVAATVAKRLKSGDVVGLGSGSTSFMTLIALAKRRDKEGLDFRALTTSIEMELVCSALHVPTTMLHVEEPSWSFDGADEVDDQGNMIKGRGGAMFREKMLMKACKEIYIVIDASKQVKKLGQNFAVPIEIHPNALNITRRELENIGEVQNIALRLAVAKDGPVITENGNLIFDVKFNKIDIDMEKRLKSLVGVIETGLFIGYKPRIILSNSTV